jgi:hypothetical protein
MMKECWDLIIKSPLLKPAAETCRTRLNSEPVLSAGFSVGSPEAPPVHTNGLRPNWASGSKPPPCCGPSQPFS